MALRPIDLLPAARVDSSKKIKLERPILLTYLPRCRPFSMTK